MSISSVSPNIPPQADAGHWFWLFCPGIFSLILKKPAWGFGILLDSLSLPLIIPISPCKLKVRTTGSALYLVSTIFIICFEFYFHFQFLSDPGQNIVHQWQLLNGFHQVDKWIYMGLFKESRPFKKMQFF